VSRIGYHPSASKRLFWSHSGCSWPSFTSWYIFSLLFHHRSQIDVEALFFCSILCFSRVPISG